MFTNLTAIVPWGKKSPICIDSEEALKKDSKRMYQSQDVPNNSGNTVSSPLFHDNIAIY